MSETKQRLNSIADSRTRRALHKLFGNNTPQIARTLFDYTNGNIGTATGAGLSLLIWSDCPRGLMLCDPTVGHFLFDDFHVVLATAYGYELTGTNGTFAKVAAQQDGHGIISCPGADNDEAYLTFANDAGGIIKADAATDWWFEARLKINQIATAQGAFVGLAEETAVAADFMTDNTMAMKVVDSIGFQIVQATDAAPTWQSMMQLNGGARAAVNATLHTATTGFVKLGMKSISGTVTFYVNGASDSTQTTSAATNFPLDQVMSPTFARKAGSAAANTMTIDWWAAAQLR